LTASTASRGATRTNELVDIVSFFGAHVLPELQGKMSDSLVLRADALKFTTTFRSQVCFLQIPFIHFNELDRSYRKKRIPL
jgi:hypothetical protein